jgi:CheY-like chemotaxis protein
LADLTLLDFEAGLQNSLNHLYNPLFNADEQVYEMLNLPVTHGMVAMRRELKKRIEELKPGKDTPGAAYSRRFFDILNYRYLESLSQEEAAFQLGMTSRSLRRWQQQAVHILAQAIWNAHQMDKTRGLPQELDNHSLSVDQPTIIQELEVLQNNSPGAVAEIGDSLERVRSIARAMLEPRQISLFVEQQEVELTVSVHPSVLVQVLLATIEQLARYVGSGEIHLNASKHVDWVEILITAPRSDQPDLFGVVDPVPGVLELIGGTQKVELDGQHVSVTVRLPAIAHVPVLLIDDNPDFFYLFRRYAQHTRYIFHNIREGALFPEALAEIHPQIIILDVLLPDVDGWQLLIDFRQGRADIPVVICSALAQKEMAYSLGAQAFLPKPVAREQLLQTLDGLAD